MGEGLHIIVLVKQVPDIERVRFNVEEGRIDRSSAPAETNPFDLNALETAVQLKEKMGGLVTAISMGPPQAESSLRDALARGADRAILLTDRRFAGADTLATSYTLAMAIRRLGAFDLIVCDEKTVDGDNIYLACNSTALNTRSWYNAGYCSVLRLPIDALDNL